MLKESGGTVHIIDPLLEINEMINDIEYDVLVFAVPHEILKKNIYEYVKAVKRDGFIFDIKGELRDKKFNKDLILL